MSRILVVDDNASTRSYMAIALRSARYDVVLASNGQEAVEMAKKQCPDLIFMDLMMPVMDGEVAAMLLKSDATTARIPIVVLSAKPLDQVPAGMRYFDRYLPKPCRLNQILKAAELSRLPVAA